MHHQATIYVSSLHFKKYQIVDHLEGHFGRYGMRFVVAIIKFIRVHLREQLRIVNVLTLCYSANEVVHELC